MYNKYVLFIPQGGINDCFSNINKVISYCKINKRTLLLDMTNSAYKINFSDYFYIKKIDNCCIIYNTNEIKNIILSLKNSNCLTIYPNKLDFNLIDLFDKTKKISFHMRHGSFLYKKIPLDLPFLRGNKNSSFENIVKEIIHLLNKPLNFLNIPLNLRTNIDENVILHSCSGGSNGFLFFKKLLLCENIKNIIKKKITLLKDNYLCIQVRNTDYKCNYEQLYENNKQYIHNFDQIYICTDDKQAYEFFKSKKLNVLCFTIFPENPYKNLHRSNIPPSIKMEDLLTDIFIATNSKSILSNSRGGFISLLRNCHKNKKYILNMLS